MFPIPKSSTKATAKYQAKVGLVAKTYKLKADVAEAFKAACKISGESQSAALMWFMAEYAKKSGSTAATKENKPLDGQLEIKNAEKCARCGTVHQSGYDENEYFRCLECDFGNYKQTGEDEDEDESDTSAAADGDDDEVLKKWAAQLKKASKKAGLPCVYQYGYGKDEPHIFVNNEKIYLSKDEAGALIRLGAVHENVPK